MTLRSVIMIGHYRHVIINIYNVFECITESRNCAIVAKHLVLPMRPVPVF